MYRFIVFSFATLLFTCFALVIAGADQDKENAPDHMEPYTGSAEFEKIKSLEGTWTGTGLMHGEEQPITVVYETTSGGSAVIETLFPDSPQEMVSIYYEEDGKLVMKHFCMLKNQPLMGLKKSNGKTIELDLIGGTNMDASKDSHMHSAVFTFVDENKIVQSWTAYENGKTIEESTTLTLSRVK